MMIRGCVVLCLLMIALPAQANLITNGDFETGTFSGWTVSANSTSVVLAPFHGYNAQSGQYFAALGTNNGLGKITQSGISTIAGDTYTLSMYLGSDGGLPNNFVVFWNNTLLTSMQSLADTRGNASQYNLLTFTVTGTGSDLLAIGERDVPGYLALDNVSLTSNNILVPEPASLTLAGLGALGLAFGAYRRNRQSQSVA